MAEDIKVVATNRKARHDFHIIETYEAGIKLQGTEVKSVRLGRVNIKDSFAKIEDGEIFLYNMHISPYEFGNRFNHDPERKRKLLMHKHEIRRLYGKVRERGFSLVPLRLYFRRNWLKVELALVKGKKLYDKREDIAKRTAQRQIDRALRGRY
ncbi:SsrA-binding protein [Anoxybacter fermentans]|uniref:SsrA-binding protein n=1 Tax=Anoxybacter fermentans TaxID=1323375 RepID=A0A3Q9HNY8_9FIRM|nr:SsrA-binding protein SmpB [Anoxybacter fermentans]AZR72288.1 SsrA-binding protein [Anoxybacter fermentans]